MRRKRPPYWNVLSYMDILGYTLEIPKANSLDPELYNMKEWGKNIMEESSFPKMEGGAAFKWLCEFG